LAVVATVEQLDALDPQSLSDREVEILGGQPDALREWWLSDVAPSFAFEELEGAIGASIESLRQQLEQRREVVVRLLAEQEALVRQLEAGLREKTLADASEELKRGRREQSKQRYDQAIERRNEYLRVWQSLQGLLRERESFLTVLEETQERISTLRGESRDALMLRLEDLKALGLPISIGFEPGNDRDRLVVYMRDP